MESHLLALCQFLVFFSLSWVYLRPHKDLLRSNKEPKGKRRPQKKIKDATQECGNPHPLSLIFSHCILLLLSLEMRKTVESDMLRDGATTERPILNNCAKTALRPNTWRSIHRRYKVGVAVSAPRVPELAESSFPPRGRGSGRQRVRFQGRVDLFLPQFTGP